MKRYRLILICLLIALSNNAYAGIGIFNKIYAGLFIPYYSIGGDFDGTKLLTDGKEFFYVPKVEPAAGYGIVLGARGRFVESETSPIDLAVEASVAMSRHNASWLGNPANVSYTEIKFDARPFFLANRRLQPYLGLGLSFGLLTAEIFPRTRPGQGTPYTT
ncbi:MAG: hypothetical protein ABII64_01670 [Elusimicrobiota bacterium]